MKDLYEHLQRTKVDMYKKGERPRSLIYYYQSYGQSDAISIYTYSHEF